MVNIRTKGASAERQIAEKLNLIIYIVRKRLNLDQYVHDKQPVQRNPLQSAIGGSDLTMPLPISIEIKRQEALSINTWWKQCVSSAQDDHTCFKTPVLLYKQSHKAWQCIMMTQMPNSGALVRSAISLESFEEWFEHLYELHVRETELGVE